MSCKKPDSCLALIVFGLFIFLTGLEPARALDLTRLTAFQAAMKVAESIAGSNGVPSDLLAPAKIYFRDVKAGTSAEGFVLYLCLSTERCIDGLA